MNKNLSYIAYFSVVLISPISSPVIDIVELDIKPITELTIKKRELTRSIPIYVAKMPNRVSAVKKWEDEYILAAAINTECRNCIYSEKIAIAQVIVERANKNHLKFGETIFDQFFMTMQFSGSTKFNSDKYKWNYCTKRAKAIYKKVNDPIVGKLFYFDSKDISCLDAMAAAKYILGGGRSAHVPLNAMYFYIPKDSSNKKFVGAMKSSEIIVPKGWRHNYAI